MSLSVSVTGWLRPEPPMLVITNYPAAVKKVQRDRRIVLAVDVLAVGISAYANAAVVPDDSGLFGTVLALVAPVFLGLTVFVWHRTSESLHGWTARFVNTGLLGLATVCAVISFSHIQELAIQELNASPRDALLIPIAIDGAAVIMAVTGLSLNKRIERINEAERVETDRLAAEQAETERVETDRLAAEQAETERVETDRLAAEQAETERVETDRLAAEQAETERVETDRLAAEQAETERVETDRLAAEQAETERVQREVASKSEELPASAPQRRSEAVVNDFGDDGTLSLIEELTAPLNGSAGDAGRRGSGPVGLASLTDLQDVAETPTLETVDDIDSLSESPETVDAPSTTQDNRPARSRAGEVSAARGVTGVAVSSVTVNAETDDRTGETKREAVLRLAKQTPRKTNKEIADAAQVGERTVRRYLQKELERVVATAQTSNATELAEQVGTTVEQAQAVLDKLSEPVSG